MPAERDDARGPVYLTPVRDHYGLDLAGGGRVEVRRHAAALTALVHAPSAGAEAAEFDLRRWHYRQWSAQIEDREYSEGLRGLIAVHGLFDHPEWITGDRPTELDAEAMTVVDDLRATWRSRFGGPGAPPAVGSQVCSLCLSAEPVPGPLTLWSPNTTQAVCPHRDAAAAALLELVQQHDELVFELLDLMVVAVMPGTSSSPPLRRFVLPSDWMRALLGHWLLGHNYVHRELPWRSRGAPRHRRFSHRALRAEGSVELTMEERYSALAWGVSLDDLSLAPEEPNDLATPENTWWSDPALASTPGVRVYPEGPTAKPAPTHPAPRTRPAPRAKPSLLGRPAPEAPSVPSPPKKAPPPKPRRAGPTPARAPKADLEETLSSLTAGLAALSQIMGGPKGGRR